MTREQLHKVCENNNYIVLTYLDNSVSAFNCKAALLSRFSNTKKNSAKTKFKTWRKCTFMEYLSLKTPFI